MIPGLAEHYTRFRVTERLLLTGHSHQAWPDVALDGMAEAFQDAAELVDTKWERAFAKADRVRHGYRALIGDPTAEIALGASTHELVVRFLSVLPLRERPRLVTTDGEFHTLRRQLGRLAEAGLEVVRVPARPVDDLAERLAAAIDARTAAVLVSAVLFEDARIVPGLDDLARAATGTELLIDVYHALGVVPFVAPPRAWILGGGYKYLQLGEGNCFLRVPQHAWDWRPVITGWYAEFSFLDRDAGCDARIPFAPGAEAFAGPPMTRSATTAPPGCSTSSRSTRSPPRRCATPISRSWPCWRRRSTLSARPRRGSPAIATRRSSASAAFWRCAVPARRSCPAN